MPTKLQWHSCRTDGWLNTNRDGYATHKNPPTFPSKRTPKNILILKCFMYHEAHCKFKNVFSIQIIQPYKNRLPSQAGGFWWNAHLTLKSVPTIQSFGKSARANIALFECLATNRLYSPTSGTTIENLIHRKGKHCFWFLPSECPNIQNRFYIFATQDFSKPNHKVVIRLP